MKMLTLKNVDNENIKIEIVDKKMFTLGKC